MSEIWIEKYRPHTLSDIVGQDEIISKLKSFVKVKDLPHLIFAGPPGTGKTSAAMALAIELFGENWKANFLELNASNERGINVIRENVKDFARIMASNDLGIKIIFLDEADQLTPEAQAALRRTMEMYSSTTRFIFSCNYSSQIIPPIQSRTVVMRFKPLKPEEMSRRLQYIAQKENFKIDADSITAITEISEGDMRKALNIIQAIETSGDVSPARIYEITGMANQEEFKQLLTSAVAGVFEKAKEILDRMLIEEGMSGMDIIRGMHSAARRETMIPPLQRIGILMALGETEFRIVEGASDNIQLDALLAKLVHVGREIN
ncbi:MAG: replication factor C small subunit [Thermoplasmataceae archaeon]